MSVVGMVCYFVVVCELLEGELLMLWQVDLLILSCYELLGVVVVIILWNLLIVSEMQKVVLVIVVGNVVIFKLVEVMLFMVLELVKIFEQVGLFVGLLSVLLGKGLIIGDVLVCYFKVCKIFFIGGIIIGCYLVYVVVEKLILVLLELGGKLLIIVLEDVDIEQVVWGICYGIFSFGGQVCIVGLWLFVYDKVYL